MGGNPSMASEASAVAATHIVLPKGCKGAESIEAFPRGCGVSSPAESVTHAKVLQIQVDLMLVYGTSKSGPSNQPSKDTKELVSVTTSIPCCLAAMDRTTAENQRACVAESLDAVLEWQRISRDFPLRLRVSTTDRYAANYRTERGLQIWMSDFNLLHLACDAHKSASCIKHSLAGSESEVSGLINSALSLGELGVLQRLRDLLTALFFNELRVHPDQAPDDEGLQQYRKAVFEQFLPLQGDKCVVNQKRRKILETMLNGDLRQAELQHYCPLGATCCANDPQQTMSTMALYVSWALLPCLNEQELDSLCKFSAAVDFPDVPAAKTWERDGHSEVRQNLSAHPVSSLVRGLVWNPPTEKAVEAGGL